MNKELNMNSPPILIVDDKKENRDSFRKLLTHAGFEVVEAASGVAALRYLLRNSVSLVLMDVQMPDANGFEVAQMIRQDSHYLDLPILFISAAYRSDDFVNYGYSVGAYDYLVKPVNDSLLINKVSLFHTLYCQRVALKRRQKETEALNRALQNNEKLQQAIQVAERAVRAKDEFLATISHELRTPLSVVIGNCELLDETSLNDEQREILGSALVSGKNLLHLINDLLDASKIDAGKFELDMKPFNLSDLLEEIRRIFLSRAKQVGIDLRFSQEFAPRYAILGDAHRIGQILSNFLSNALKFTRQGTVALRCWKHEQTLNFSVEDSGIGMSPETLERLFHPFEQEDSSIARRYGGTGLGLYISKALAELMEGHIDVVSSDGKGSCFTLSIPYRGSDQPLEVSQQQDSAASLSTERFSGSVLLAEDAPDLQQLMIHQLKSQGSISVTIAADGVEAITLAKQSSFDLILMDMQMPVMDGVKATRILRERGDQTPIVAVTANVMQRHKKQFFDAGITDFLQKPLKRTALQRVLKSYLRNQSSSPKTPARSPKTPKTGPKSVDKLVDDEMMQVFRDTMSQRHEQMKQAFSTGEWRQVDDIAHTIKGTASLFGYQSLSTLAEKLQHAIKQKQSEQMSALTTQFLVEIQKIL